jgi:hypothetical protein
VCFFLQSDRDLKRERESLRTDQQKEDDKKKKRRAASKQQGFEFGVGNGPNPRLRLEARGLDALSNF